MVKIRKTRTQFVSPGDKYGVLTVVCEIHNPNSSVRKIKCLCDCGAERNIVISVLLNKSRKTCRCAEKHRHNMSGTRLYHVWINMIQRCENKNFTHYHRYGGRGISICKEWREDVTVFRDWSLANGYADNLELDRRDNDGNYCPDNCRWVTRSVNSKNKGHILKLNYNNELLTVPDILKLEGIHRHKIDSFKRRLRDGDSVEEIVKNLKEGKRKTRN